MKKKKSEAFYIGVTGHRFIPDDARLGHSIRQALSDFLQDCGTKDVYLFSALAEGTDQLVAIIALDLKIELCVPLPKSLNHYMEDFLSDEGIESFEDILSTAIEIISLSSTDETQDAYEGLGKYLVEHSDVLLAVWNGVYNQNKGGTGEVVKHALKSGLLIYWIYCENLGEEDLSHQHNEKQIGDVELLINSEFNRNSLEWMN